MKKLKPTSLNSSRMHFVNCACKRWVAANHPAIYNAIVDQSYKEYPEINRLGQGGAQQQDYGFIAKLGNKSK